MPSTSTHSTTLILLTSPPSTPPSSIPPPPPTRARPLALLWQYKAVNHRAFLYAPETGDYTVTIPNSDEITLIWFGEKAIEGWTRANADLEQDYPGGTSKTFTIHLTAGTYTPFRLLWANAQGDLNFIAEVQAPDGKVIVNGDGSDNKYFVRFACDESTPSFPDFGYGG
ncbi:uncharacterized protein LW94_11242 [Fusarium fujikuroi]|nr:uncharacterized protein LW94_11242 [Fusarium fujikuroi]